MNLTVFSVVSPILAFTHDCKRNPRLLKEVGDLIFSVKGDRPCNIILKS
ncbi:hypothetical protein QUA41_05215 [Microcoleus sp. Pol11C1]